MRKVPRRRTVLSLAALTSLCAVGCDKEKSIAPTTDTKDQAAALPEKEGPSQKRVDSFTLPKLGEMAIPATNPQTDEKIALGNQLFFDKRLSVDGSVSCYSCHENENGNGGATPLAIGAKQTMLTRHSPVMWNVGYLPALYWDGRADSLEAQAKGAWGGGNMGVGKENLDQKARELAALPEYKDAISTAFPGQEVSADLIVQAISAYERTLVCNDTAYDKYAAGDKSALSNEQKDGLELFMGKGMCTACHSPPLFTSANSGKGTYFNVGVGTKGVEEKDVDVGRMKVSENASDWAAFKPPSLRNVSKSAPYFHDGSAADLKTAVTFMATGGHDNKNKSPMMTDKKLSEQEIGQIITFLGALDCGGTLREPQAVPDAASKKEETTTPSPKPAQTTDKAK